MAEVQIAIIISSRPLEKEGVSSPSLGIEACLIDGRRAAFLLDGSEAWTTLTSWSSTDPRSLVGRACWMLVEEESAKFVTMWSTNVPNIKTAEEVAALKFPNPMPDSEGGSEVDPDSSEDGREDAEEGDS